MLEEVAPALLLIGQGSVICFPCNHIFSIEEAKKDFACPSCGTHYRYFAFKNIELDVRHVEAVSRLMPDARFIDYHDFQREFNKKKAKEFFK